MNYGLVVAAGRGLRFGGEKQYALLNGKPVLFYPLKAFQDSTTVDAIVLVVAAGQLDRVRTEIVDRYGLDKVAPVVPGGQERQDSVAAGLVLLPETGMVAVHDGARPFVTPRMLEHGFQACAVHHAVIYGIPVGDTVKRVVDGAVRETVDRSGLVLAQTPQFFDLDLLHRAYREARARNIPATDDSLLIEQMANPVRVLPGDSGNIKITTPFDLALAEALLARDSFPGGRDRP